MRSVGGIKVDMKYSENVAIFRLCWLLILVCLFVACSDLKDESPLEVEMPVRDAPPFRLAAWNIRIFSDASRDDAELRHIGNQRCRI